jgi:hypothetical protein
MTADHHMDEFRARSFRAGLPTAIPGSGENSIRYFPLLMAL